MARNLAVSYFSVASLRCLSRSKQQLPFNKPAGALSSPREVVGLRDRVKERRAAASKEVAGRIYPKDPSIHRSALVAGVGAFLLVLAATLVWRRRKAGSVVAPLEVDRYLSQAPLMSFQQDWFMRPPPHWPDTPRTDAALEGEADDPDSDSGALFDAFSL